MKCESCSKEMRLVPAGISKKTGKPYNSFYGCKCGATHNLEEDKPIQFEPTVKDVWEELKGLRESINNMSDFLLENHEPKS